MKISTQIQTVVLQPPMSPMITVCLQIYHAGKSALIFYLKVVSGTYAVDIGSVMS